MKDFMSDPTMLIHLGELLTLVVGVVWHFARVEARLAVLERLVRILLNQSGIDSGD